MRLLLLLYSLTLAWSLTSANVESDLDMAAIASDLVAPHDGQPGCAIRYEFRRQWRNNFNPENFWECTRWREAATQRNCPPFTRFQESWQTCVPENQWEWTPYMEPPTRPGSGQVEECDELETDTCECPDPTPPTPPTADPPVDTTTPIIPTEGPDDKARLPCPGASDEQNGAVGEMSCFKPECTMQQWLDGTLYPTEDPTHFFQCGPGTGNIFRMPCGPGTCFSFRHQVCIHIRDWFPDCAP